ncbi:MAG: tetratricopeptide repeat protein, partial [Sedimenticola sp.]
MEDLNSIAKALPYLTHPLSLIGFVGILFFGVHRVLLKAGIIPQVTKNDGSHLVRLLLRYGFIIALVIISLGFGLEYYKHWVDSVAATSPNRHPQDEKIIGRLIKDLENKDLTIEERRAQIQDLSTTIDQLRQTANEGGKLAQQTEKVLRDLAEGAPAKTLDLILARLTEQYEETQISKAAALYRGRGALAYNDRTSDAIHYYTRSTELEPDDPSAWNQLGYLRSRIGDLDAAIQAFQRVELLGKKNGRHDWIAGANLGLGIVYTVYGELHKAEEFHLKALAINEKLDCECGTGSANSYAGLGVVYTAHGKSDKAEEFFLKALAIYEERGGNVGMASQYGNLGTLYKRREGHDKAKEFYLKALAIYEELGHKEGMSEQYSNLGLIYQTRGELNKAEEFHLKALAINEALGQKKEMPIQFGNLGLIYQTRGELNKAEEFLLKSLAIEEMQGNKEGMASDYINLGLFYQTRGELNKAEEFLLKSLAIEEALGDKEGISNAYGLLGMIYHTRDELNTAEGYYRKAL